MSVALLGSVDIAMSKNKLPILTEIMFYCGGRKTSKHIYSFR